MENRTGQVWELHDLGELPRAGLIVGLNASEVAKVLAREGIAVWNVVMLTGRTPGRRLTWQEDMPFEDNDRLTRLA